MSVAATVAAVAALLLSGCDNTPPTADDPREGRVTLTYSDCGLGLCVYDWKACAGPDLIVHIGGSDHVAKDSEECAR